jgi:hypothetical protein
MQSCLPGDTHTVTRSQDEKMQATETRVSSLYVLYEAHGYTNDTIAAFSLGGRLCAPRQAA